MKTTTFKSVLLAFTLVILSSLVNAQDLVGTRIDVQGSRYSDQMWIFAVSTCTTGFDNGWDGYKMFGSSTVIPQIYAAEPSANFQIDAVPTFNNTYISFKAGEDTVYTMTFTNQLVETLYSELYLVDSVANCKVNILSSGTKYTFNVQPTSAPVKRFKIVAVTPSQVVVPTPPVVVPTDTVVTVPTTPEVTPTTPAAPIDTVVTAPTNPTKPVITKPAKDKTKKVKVHNSKKNIVIENSSKEKGKAHIYNAKNGKLQKTYNFNANGKTEIATSLPTGTYIIQTITNSEEATTTVVIQ
jgi:hypothetical protein